MSKVVELLSLKDLMPHLHQRRLLTSDEAKSLSIAVKKDVLAFFRILKSKGPTAFAILVECVGDEKQHIGHHELYTIITEDQPLPTPNPAKPCELSCGPELTCQEYHDRRHQFEKYYHSGRWEECYKLAQICMGASSPEVRVIGHLELALSYVFRINKEEVCHHVTEAEILCKNIENSNGMFLSDRCK
jgi:hypothetical protein